MSHLTPVIHRRDTERKDWIEWLYEHKAFRFGVKHLLVTFRCEPYRQGEFWYAYRRIDGRLNKRYAGRSEDMTYERLVETVKKFCDL